MAKAALLAVSFGTSYPDTRKRTITAIERDLADAFPERAFYSAWTSNIIRKRLDKENGEKLYDVATAFDKMAEDGIEEVLVQPTHIMDGKEVLKIKNAILEEASRGRFKKISAGAPLLVTAEDRAAVAKAIADSIPRKDNAMVALMGHGTPGGPNDVYFQVQDELAAIGRDDCKIATVEGDGEFEDLLEAVDAAKPETVQLAPFMIVAGDHANNDLLGDEEDSWKSQIEQKGYKTESHLRGIGELPAIRQLIVEHARQAL